jgi:F-type H+-transporting ATPase subunit epsilon
MARTPFQVEILSPEGEVFNDEVEMLSTRTTVGSIGVLAHHQPTELRLYKSESDVVTFAQGEGYLQMTGERALVLVDEVFERDQLDASEVKERLAQAEKDLEGAEDDTEEQRTAKRSVKRYEAFLKLAESR